MSPTVHVASAGDTADTTYQAPTFDQLADQSPSGIMAAWDQIAAFYPPFWQNPVGYAAWAGSGAPIFNPDTLPVLWVTSPADSGPGSYRAALLTPGDAVIRMAITQDVVDPNRQGWSFTGNKIVDGRGYPGSFYGAHQPMNMASIGLQYLSTSQPFAYGKNVSGGVYGWQNVTYGYGYRLTGSDTGDVVGTGGAYYENTGQIPGPFYLTWESCLFGRNPGPYGLGSPILSGEASKYPWAVINDPYRCGIDNDAGNGKMAESAYDHNQESLSPYPLRLQQFVTWHRCLLQMGAARNLKVRAQTGHAHECVVTKWGHPFNVAAKVPGTNYGQGSCVQDEGVLLLENCVYVPYNAGEPWGALMPDEAAAAGVPAVYVTSPLLKVFSTDGTAPQTGNMRMSGCWLPPGATMDTPAYTTGPQVPYTLPGQDRSAYADALALVTQLDSEAGNPCARVKLRSWRMVHQSTEYFPNAA